MPQTPHIKNTRCFGNIYIITKLVLLVNVLTFVKYALLLLLFTLT